MTIDSALKLVLCPRILVWATQGEVYDAYVEWNTPQEGGTTVQSAATTTPVVPKTSNPPKSAPICGKTVGPFVIP